MVGRSELLPWILCTHFFPLRALAEPVKVSKSVVRSVILGLGDSLDRALRSCPGRDGSGVVFVARFPPPCDRGTSYFLFWMGAVPRCPLSVGFPDSDDPHPSHRLQPNHVSTAD